MPDDHTRVGLRPSEYDGISHDPREFSTPKQRADGVNVFLDVLTALNEAESP